MGSLSTREFSVKDLQGLSLWLKADAGVILDGSNVTAWEDQSENGNNATAIQAPAYATNIINGKPALVFANDAHLTTANIFNGANPRTVIAAYYIDSDNYSNTVVAQSNEDDTVMGTYFMLQSRIDQNSSPYLAGYVDDLSGPAFVSPELLIGMADYDGTTARLFKNGVEVNSDVKNYNTHNGQLYIGACNIAGAVVEYFGGKIAEIIIYNRILTTPERQQVEAYLNNKYAIYTPINPIKNTKISIKKQNTGAGKLTFDRNYILNSKFTLGYTAPPYTYYDANYFRGGWAGGGSKILTNYYHNSPLFYEGSPDGYQTYANRTYHEINSPYDRILSPYDPLTLQPRLIKLYGVGSKFSRADNLTNYLKTITNTTSLTPTDSQSWVKYGVEQIVSIPSAARKITYGVKYLTKSDDLFRENNFGGLVLYFQLGNARSYVNTHIIKSSNSSTPISTLESLYTQNTYVNFDADYGSNAMCQWLGPNTSKVKVKRRSSILSSTDSIVTLSDTIDIPTFSAAGAQPDAVVGFPKYVSLQMFFAEWVAYLNLSGILSGAIYFYEPFLYFEY